MSNLVSYEFRDGFATIAMDDGKVNALSPAMLSELGAAFDRAQSERAAVLLTGREGRFSAGFDLRVLQSDPAGFERLVLSGFLLAERLLAYPRPLLLACNGHALAMGSFLLLSADYRIGAAGAFKIGANEVAIGMTMPEFAVEICRQRLSPLHFQRAVIMAELYSPEAAVSAGFLDAVVAPTALQDAARTKMAELLKLDPDAHSATKLRARAPALRALRAAIEADTQPAR